MFLLFVTLIAASSLGQYEIGQEGVRVRIQVESSVYRYEVHNLNLPPIRSFAIQAHHAYSFEAPQDWTTHEKVGVFEAEANNVFSAILAGQQRNFSMRVTSGGAILGEVPLQLGFDHRDAISLNVWGPVPTSRRYLLYIVLVMAGIFLIHTLIVGYYERKRTKSLT